MKEIFDFGRKILIVFFIALPFILFNSCEHLLDAPSIPNEKTTAGGTLSAPTGLKASQGLKRKINLSWNAVEGAKLYYIYKASNPNEEFIQVGETAEISYEIKASPGTTDYYRVVAAKSDGTRSPISAMSEAGASLALPVFSGADVDESTITVYWDMENASYYKEKLRFEVKQEDTATGMTTSRLVSGNDPYSCDFENLESNSKYVYSIDAYLTDAPDEKENSGKTTVATMALRRPQPPKFTASEGEYKDKVRLSITLPPKVQVSINSDLGGIIETDYPVYFEVSRKRGEKGAYEVIEKALYYDGSTGNEGATSGYDGYVAGKTFVWDDTNFTEQDRGVKYEYKIKSYIDYKFLPQNGSPKTSSRNSDTCIGWMSQRPKFTVSGKMSEGNQYSVNLGIDWNAMGKGDEYKFAIKLEKKAANLSAGNGEVSWLAKDDENFFKTDVEPLNMKYDVDEKMYCYTLYVVKSQATIDKNAISEEYVLEEVAAAPVLVADLANFPTSKFSVDDGYPDKVVLNLVLDEGKDNSDVSYELVRKLNGGEEKIIDAKFNDGKYTDGNLEGGKKYEYVMYATKKGSAISVPSESKEAVTLGKPDPNVVKEGDGKKKLAYDEIYLEMYEVFGAKSYCLTLGKSGDFGGGKTLVFDADGKKTSGDMNANISLVDQKFAIRIEKPCGYNDATLAGKGVSLEVVARGYEDAARNEDKESKGILADAKVMGPATLTVSGSKENGVTENEITLKWNKVEDAIGYAIVRKRAEDNNNDVFYVSNSDKPKVSLAEADTTAAGASLCEKLLKVEYDGNQYKFVDETDIGFEANSPWLENQKRIAWGYEYTYTVIPLLAEGDAGLMLGGGGATDFTVKYENLDEKNKKVASGYTYGYGLNVKASKADYANKIKISWDVPKYARENASSLAKPKIYRRLRSDGRTSNNELLSWKESEYIGTLESTAESTFSYEDKTLDISDRKVYEYAVRYGLEEKSENIFKTSYEKDLWEKLDDGEQDNHGYLFNLPGFECVVPSAQKESFEETVKFNLYNNTERKKGPGDGSDIAYTLYVKNLNNSEKWFPVASYSKDGSLISAVSSDWYAVGVSSNKTTEDVTTTMTPTDIGKTTITRITRASTTAGTNTVSGIYDGTHNGLLKVQRDYKHYYRIEARRKNADGDIIRTSIGGKDADYEAEKGEACTEDMAHYTYRKITDDEFVKGITLIIADAIYQGGVNSGNGNSDITGEIGTFVANYEITGIGNNGLKWGTNEKDYKHIFPCIVGNKDEKFVSDWSLNAALQSNRPKCAGYGKLVYLPENTVKVTHTTGLPSYQGWVIPRAGKQASGGNVNGPSHTWDVEIQYSRDLNVKPESNNQKIVITGWDKYYDEKKDSKEGWHTVGGNEAEFYEWFPFNIGVKNGNAQTSLNTNLPTYQNDWWLER